MTTTVSPYGTSPFERYRHIVVEGPIGVGKTSLARRMADRFHAQPVFEDAGGDQVVGSGYTQTADEQLEELASNAAIEIERWLRDNESWFGGRRARSKPPLPLPLPLYLPLPP